MIQSCFFFTLLGYLGSAYAQHYVLSNASDLYMFDRKYDIIHSLELSEYFDTITHLGKCADSLKIACESRQNSSCNYSMDQYPT